MSEYQFDGMELAGSLERLMQRISGDGGAHWAAALKCLVSKKDACVGYPVWRTIKVGGKPINKFPSAFRAAGVRVTSGVKDMMIEIVSDGNAAPHTVCLARVSLKGLGFSDYTRLPDSSYIIQRGRTLGLTCCGPTVGLYLRLAYRDQPLNELVWVAMDPIKLHSHGDTIFALGHDKGGLYIGGSNQIIKHGRVQSLDCKVIFALRQQP